MRKPLTKRQLAIYEYIAAQIRQRGIPPTIREICDQFGMRSSNGAREALAALARKGYINRRERLSRGIELANPFDSLECSGTPIRVPLLRNPVKGARCIDEATGEKVLFIDSSFLPGTGRAFALLVPDGSLAKYGIRKGDLAIATECHEGQPGEILITAIDSRLVLVRVPATSDPEPSQQVPESHGVSSVFGKVNCVVRRFTGVETG